MKPSLEPGIAHELRDVVREDMTVTFLGDGVPPTLSTPAMILLMERAARLLLEPHLDDGESSVGTVVNVRHIAPTPLGIGIAARATVIGIDGRRCTFAVECFDDQEKIGEGEHERFVISVARFAPRVAAKSRPSA